jgi:RNA polymerase sigma factor (sigma-70 family)
MAKIGPKTAPARLWQRQHSTAPTVFTGLLKLRHTPHADDISASQAVRNALRSLYEKQVRHHHHHAYVLDQPAGMQSTQTDLVQNTPDKKQESVATQVNRAESIAALHRAMAQMPERYRVVLTAIGQGRSYSEIGDQLGMTKQGVHKIAAAATQALREHLESQGFGGLDSVGLLKSFRQE